MKERNVLYRNLIIYTNICLFVQGYDYLYISSTASTKADCLMTHLLCCTTSSSIQIAISLDLLEGISLISEHFVRRDLSITGIGIAVG